MTVRIGRNGEVKFEFWPDQPPSTKAGEWRCRLGASHFGTGPTIEAALKDIGDSINREFEAIERARLSIQGRRVAVKP